MVDTMERAGSQLGRPMLITSGLWVMPFQTRKFLRALMGTPSPPPLPQLRGDTDTSDFT
jgi:hypothetical protein